ncbi:MAG: MBL fold metallo-hydrolase [Idiomarina sp.]|nr:MBL fold metallo-hydrolase [Idiomarina sp.]
MRVLISFLIILGIALLLGLPGCSSPASRTDAARPAHHTDDGFRNPHMPPHDKDSLAFFRMRLFGGYEWADQTEQLDEMPVQSLDPSLLTQPTDALRATWIGHATLLVQYGEVNVITDPMFSHRASPVRFAGPARHFPPAIDPNDLPPIDVVVISHNHYEHLDLPSIRALGNHPWYFVPLGNGDLLIDAGIDPERVIEMDWWDEVTKTIAGQQVRVVATPSQHWSARSLWDRNHALWAAWRVDIDTRSVWFAGDTGYNDMNFRETAERYGPVDLALIPIGAYLPRSFMKDSHVNPQEAVKMHQDIQACRSIAMHWGTFPLSAEGLTQPADDLRIALADAGIHSNRFDVFAIGESRLYQDRLCQVRN